MSYWQIRNITLENHHQLDLPLEEERKSLITFLAGIVHSIQYTQYTVGSGSIESVVRF